MGRDYRVYAIQNPEGRIYIGLSDKPRVLKSRAAYGPGGRTMGARHGIHGEGPA